MRVNWTKLVEPPDGKDKASDDEEQGGGSGPEARRSGRERQAPARDLGGAGGEAERGGPGHDRPPELRDPAQEGNLAGGREPTPNGRHKPSPTSTDEEREAVLRPRLQEIGKAYSGLEVDGASKAAVKRQRRQRQAAPSNPSPWRSAYEIAAPFITSRTTRRRALGLIAAMFAVLFLECAALLRFSEVQKSYMTALEAKDNDKFYVGLRAVCWLVLFCLPVFGSHAFTQMALEIEWRSAITQRLGHSYLAGGGPCGRGAFYRISQDSTIDNPDQRLCQDADDFVRGGLQLMIDINNSIIRLVGFAGLLYHISPSLCLGIITYTLVGAGMAIVFFAPRIFYWHNLCIKQEATLRYCLIRVREYAESVAFFRGGPNEWNAFQQMFARLRQLIYRRIYNLTAYYMFNGGFRYSTIVLPVLLVGPSYMRGEVEFGTVSQTSFAFTQIFEALMVLSDKIPTFAFLSVQATRLRTLQAALEQEEEEAAAQGASVAAASLVGAPSSGAGSIALEEHMEDVATLLEISELTLRTPLQPKAPQQTIVENLTLELRSGKSLLIAGESGIGKSSLLRAIAGLWSSGHGRVRRCGGSGVFFMPQRPYMCLGTLREQLLYPNPWRPDQSDASLSNALQQVNLGYLLERHSLDSDHDWASMLSLGEQQRINFARLLLQPDLRLALLDEGTSACDSYSEGKLYAALKERLESYVSVGHRPMLRRYHTHALLLERKAPLDAAPNFGGKPCSARHSFLSMAEFESLPLSSM